MDKHSILVIEDNDQNRYLVRFILEKGGFEVIEASTGVAGLELARDRSFALILLDIQLPEMDGYEVARQLRADHASAGPPIVAVTSYAMVGDREKILEAGCDGYIEKPINPDTFLDEVAAYINGGA